MAAPGSKGTADAAGTGPPPGAPSPAPQAPPSANAAVDEGRRALDASVERELVRLRGDTDRLEAELRAARDLLDQIKTTSIVLTVALGLAAFAGYGQLKQWLAKLAEGRLAAVTEAEVAKALPQMLEATQARAEASLLRLAKVLALQSANAFDEALREFGWKDQVAVLRKEPAAVRRAIIDCLHRSTERRTERRAAAWKAVEELAQDDASVQTLRFYLSYAIKLRKHEEGSAFLKAREADVLADPESALLGSTLLRKLGQLDEALKIASAQLDTDDSLHAAVAVAALQRDLGRLDDVQDVLRPRISKLLATNKDELPDGWHRLANTFIANCIDRAQPEEAVPCARLLLERSSGPVEAFTAGRLVDALAASDPNRSALLEKFRRVVEALPDGEAALRARALLMAIDGDRDGALKLCLEQLERVAPSEGKRMSTDTYYLRCNIAELLIKTGDTQRAIDILMPTTSSRFGGEAKYVLSVAYAMQQEGRDSSRWLSAAIEETPKWARRARDEMSFRGLPEIDELLAKRGRDSLSSGRPSSRTPPA